MKSIFSVLIGFLTITYANNGHATSLEPFMGSRAYALGGNAVGLADDIVSALYYNPGGLNEIKGQKAAFFLFFIKNQKIYWLEQLCLMEETFQIEEFRMLEI